MKEYTHTPLKIISFLSDTSTIYKIKHISSIHPVFSAYISSVKKLKYEK